MGSRPTKKIRDPSGNCRNPEGEDVSLTRLLAVWVSGVGEEDVKRYLREELSVLRRVGGFDACVSLFFKKCGGLWGVVAVYDAASGISLRQLLLDVAKSIARAVEEEVARR